MSLEYATDHLTAAVGSLAKSERPLPERLQLAWDDHLQMLWMQPCLTADLLAEFRGPLASLHRAVRRPDEHHIA